MRHQSRKGHAFHASMKTHAFATRKNMRKKPDRADFECIRKGQKEEVMGIVVNLDVMMAKRKIGVKELSEQIDITMANLSILKNNKARAVRFSTLDAICRALNCQPGDILEYVEDEADEMEKEG